MDRNITEFHQFLSWTEDGCAYLVTWTPGEIEGCMTFRAGDDDFKTWCNQPVTFPFRAAVVAEIGIDKWAELQINFRHAAHLVELQYEAAA